MGIFPVENFLVQCLMVKGLFKATGSLHSETSCSPDHDGHSSVVAGLLDANNMRKDVRYHYHLLITIC